MAHTRCSTPSHYQPLHSGVHSSTLGTGNGFGTRLLCIYHKKKARGRQRLGHQLSKQYILRLVKRAVSVAAVVCQLKLPAVLIKRDRLLLEFSTSKDSHQLIHATDYYQAMCSPHIVVFPTPTRRRICTARLLSNTLQPYLIL